MKLNIGGVNNINSKTVKLLTAHIADPLVHIIY